jgi:hypothetical protein
MLRIWRLFVVAVRRCLRPREAIGDDDLATPLAQRDTRKKEKGVVVLLISLLLYRHSEERIVQQ